MHSPYSFLDGGSDIETLVRRAASFGMPALALTDHNTAAAAVKFSAICHAYSIKPILGAELTMEDHSHLTLLARNREGYANLCRLITAAHSHGGRLTPRLPWRALGIEGWDVPNCGVDEWRSRGVEEKVGSWQSAVGWDPERADSSPLLLHSPTPLLASQVAYAGTI